PPSRSTSGATASAAPVPVCVSAGDRPIEAAACFFLRTAFFFLAMRGAGYVSHDARARVCRAFPLNHGVTLTANPVAGSVVKFGTVAVTTVEPTPSGSNSRPPAIEPPLLQRQTSVRVRNA